MSQQSSLFRKVQKNREYFKNRDFLKKQNFVESLFSVVYELLYELC